MKAKERLIKWIFFSFIMVSLIFVLNDAQSAPKLPNANSSVSRFEIRINVGGERWLDSHGREWLPDQRYQSGSYGFLGFSDSYTTTNQISGTDNPRIYQSERFKLFGYRIDVPNGHYEISLHFAEIYHSKSGKRLMDIKIEDKPVIKNLDIVAEAGPNAALVKTINTKELNIPILDKRIDIEFINKRDVVKLSAIEVIQLAEQSALLDFDPQQLDFGLLTSAMDLSIKNIGSNPVSWTLQTRSLPTWLKVTSDVQGLLSAETVSHISFVANRSVVERGIHNDSLVITASGKEFVVPVAISKSGQAKLTIQPPVLDFKDGLRRLPCVISNSGGSVLNWSIDRSRLPQWIKRIYPTSGKLALGEQVSINISINRKYLSTGVHSFQLPIRSDSGMDTVPVKITYSQQQRHLYVKSDAAGKGNGESWDHAFKRIKDAVQSLPKLTSSQTVQIWVAAGKYYENEIMVPSGVQFYGGFCGDESALEERQHIWQHPTIVDGQRKARCFELEHRTVIDGFVIQNGRDWSSGDGKGAAILSYDADVQIRNNLIRDNVDSWAGALFIEGFELQKKVSGVSPLVERNVFINNFSNYCAAAIEIRGSAAVIRHNTIVYNKGFGLEIQDLLGPYQQPIYGKFYNNIVAGNSRHKDDDVWAEARKVTNYSFVGKQWTLHGQYAPYDYGTGNIFGDVTESQPGFIDGEKGNFRLTLDSPCIDAGDPLSKPDPDGSRADMGAFPLNKADTELELNPAVINFGSQLETQSMIFRAYSSNPVKWQTAWLAENGDEFTVSPTSGVLKNGEQAELIITLNRSNIAPGMFTGYLAVMTANQSYEAKLNYTINKNSPEMKVDPAAIAVEAIAKKTDQKTETITISNIGSGQFSWQVSAESNSNWLNISPTSGRDGQSLTIRFDASKLSFGDFFDNLVIKSSEAINKSLVVPITLRIGPAKFVYEIEAESSPSLPNSGWQVTTNEGSKCIQAAASYPDAPDDVTRLDYEFFVPDGVEHVYIFAEVDINLSKSNDSFWVMVNGFDPCHWDGIRSRYDGWVRSWVFHQKRDKKHLFVVIPGKNTLNLFVRESGGFFNWLVITNDPNINILTYKFGSQADK